MTLVIEKPTDPKGLTLEAWAQGFMCGSLVIMAAITIANMRRKVLLHKLILIELIFGMFQGTFIFPDPPAYGWYLSVGGIFLNTSWTLHNVVAWLKNKPFFSRKVSYFYIGTVILVQPYWVLEITANFLYFNPPYNPLFTHTRPFEALFRDPWWIFTVISLFWNIKRRYEFGVWELIRVSPRFGVLLAAMVLSVCFIVVDILSVTKVIHANGAPDGINPFWKLAFVFKCLTDTVILDDFKTALDRLKQHRMQQLGQAPELTFSIFDHWGDDRRDSRSSKSKAGKKVKTDHQERRSDAPSSRATSTAKPSAGWEADIERLDFCTVPDPVYLGEKKD